MTSEKDKDLKVAFPAAVCPIKPFGNRVIVQIRNPKKKTAGGLILTGDDQDHILRNEQTAKVINIGNSAFTFPSNGEVWPSGRWFEEGDFVRVPLHGGDNHWISCKNESGESELILFKTFKDFEVIGKIEGCPLDVKTNYAHF